MFAPPHRAVDQKLPIEMLYSDADLAITTSHGKRLYFMDEVEQQNQPFGPPLLVVKAIDSPPPTKREIISKLASQVVDANGRQVAISKSHFAKYVLEGIDDFARIDF